jgi:hypothetical protein
VIEDDFIVPTAPTVCVCGIALGTKTHPLSTNVQVVDAHVSPLNVVTEARLHLPEFEFAPDPDTGAGLEVGNPQDPATLPLCEEATWFGFSAVVDSFALPTLGPDEIFVLGFHVTLPQEELPLVGITQFAAGEGESDGFSPSSREVTMSSLSSKRFPAPHFPSPERPSRR